MKVDYKQRKNNVTLDPEPFSNLLLLFGVLPVSRDLGRESWEHLYNSTIRSAHRSQL